MDALAHVNNVVYLRYLQEARVDMLFTRDPGGSLAQGVVVARHGIAYRVPLRFRPAPIRVETWVREIKAASFTLGYEILDVHPGADGGEERRTVYAEAESVLVPYDLTENRPRRLSPAERGLLETYLDDADSTTGGQR